MTLFYQVDCSVASSGKRIAVTKRRVRWRWGIANEDSLASGATGVQCRGYEHEVTLIWSITSGKRLVLLDGKEIHFSAGRRTEGKFQYSWTATETGNHFLTLTAYAAAPLKPIPGFKQFDLAINGQSYSDMNHIYELGVQGNHTKSRQLTTPTNMRYDAIAHPPGREEEIKWAQQVIRLEQKREMNHAGSTPPTRSQSLPVHAPPKEMNSVKPHSTSVTFARDFLSESPVIVNHGDLLSASLPIENNHCQTSSDDEFNPNRPPTYEAIWSTIMDAYDSSGSNQVDSTNQVDSRVVESEQWRTTESTVSNINPAPVYSAPIHQIQTENTHYEYGSTRGQTNGIPNNSVILHVQTENTDYDSENVQFQSKNIHNKADDISPRGVSGIDGVMQNLVNLDDILSPVFNTTLTMNRVNKKESTVNRSINSRGLPTKMGSPGQIGHPPTLQELKQMQGNENLNPTKEVMKIHRYYAAEQNSAALVIYPQHQQYNNYAHTQMYR